MLVVMSCLAGLSTQTEPGPLVNTPVHSPHMSLHCTENCTPQPALVVEPRKYRLEEIPWLYKYVSRFWLPSILTTNILHWDLGVSVHCITLVPVQTTT